MLILRNPKLRKSVSNQNPKFDFDMRTFFINPRIVCVFVTGPRRRYIAMIIKLKILG